MSAWPEVHLIFCEGPHDAAFLHRLLKSQLNFTQARLKISELPYPLANVLQQGFRTRAAEDIRMDLAKKFFLPDYLLSRQETMVAIFNYGGSNRRANMLPFLRNIFALLEAPFFGGGTSVHSFAIFADADAHGPTRAREEIAADFADIDGRAWLQANWAAHDSSKAAIQETQFGSVAAYIWHKWGEDRGTLEDVIFECMDGEEGFSKTLNFLDERFSWHPAAGATPTELCASAAKRLKAAFCVEGQRNKPGMSLGVVLDQSGLPHELSLGRSAAVQDCVAFLRGWLM